MITPEGLMQDAIDLHVHCAPDAYTRRRVDAFQLARQAHESKMRAVVIKNHHFGTGPIAAMANQVIERPVLIGSLCLNASVGGLNASVVETAARTGAKVVWMPTLSSSEDMAQKGKPAAAIALTDDAGRLVTALLPVLDIIQKYRLILATGHISIPETFALTRYAREEGIKVIITHPIAKFAGHSLTLEQVQDLAALGAYIEFCFLACMPPERQSPQDMTASIRAIGVEHCLLTTDFGQDELPPPTEGLRMAVGNLLRAGLTEKEVEVLIRTNPGRLLDLA